MTDRDNVKCPECGTRNEIHDGGGASCVVEMVCWDCDTGFYANRYKKSVVEKKQRERPAKEHEQVKV